MDEEDIDASCGSLSERCEVVYEASQSGADEWKRLGNCIRQREAILDVSPKPRPHCRKSLHLVYNHPSVKIPEGVTMSNLDNALRELREKRSHAQVEIEKLDQIISGIESLNGTGAASSKTAQPKRFISLASRRKMARAQKARWASIRKNSQPMLAAKTGSAPAKRKISAAGRKRIAAAQKARWAKLRAQEKKAA